MAWVFLSFRPSFTYFVPAFEYSPKLVKLGKKSSESTANSGQPPRERGEERRESGDVEPLPPSLRPLRLPKPSRLPIKHTKAREKYIILPYFFLGINHTFLCMSYEPGRLPRVVGSLGGGSTLHRHEGLKSQRHYLAPRPTPDLLVARGGKKWRPC